jgi:hypothetical protein
VVVTFSPLVGVSVESATEKFVARAPAEEQISVPVTSSLKMISGRGTGRVIDADRPIAAVERIENRVNMVAVYSIVGRRV